MIYIVGRIGRVIMKLRNKGSLIEKIINIPELKSFLIELNTNGKVPEILNEMIIQSKVEFNYEDLSEND